MYIIGTAGHVDHGKSALVKALSGIDPDRLPQEKERLLTIELGFASFVGHNGQDIAIIDVPGHERFIRAMAGGIWSLDLALLVVAADDGWMQQTEDHSRVLKAMGVTNILSVITKADLATAERITALQADIASRLEALYGYRPETVVTSTYSGQGIDTLKEAIETQLASRARRQFPPALYIDRCFLIDGIGAVATGSVRQQNLEIGAQVTVLPGGQQARIKTIHSWGKAVRQAGDGTRIALSLQGVGRQSLKRGTLITADPSLFRTSATVTALLTAVEDGRSLKLKRITEVEIASATWHDWATVHVIGPVEGPALLATLTTTVDRPWYWDQPVVLIRSGSSHVLAQGRVVTARTLERTELKRLADLLGAHGSLGELCMDESTLLLYLDGYGMCSDRGPAFTLAEVRFVRFGQWYLSEAILGAIERKITEQLKRSPSVPLQTFKQESGLPPALAESVARHIVDKQLAVLDGATLVARGQKTSLTAEEAALLQKIEACGWEGYPVKWVEKGERATITALRQKKAIILVEALWFYSTKTFLAIATLILKGKEVGTLFSIAEAKEHLPLSRKYMLPLLNTMQDEGFVRRVGDLRQVVRHPEGQSEKF